MQSLRWKSGRFFDIRERKAGNIQFLQKKIKNMEDSLLDKRETMWYNNKAVARGKAALRNSKERVNRKRRAEKHRCREQGAAKRKGRKLNGSFRRERAKKRLYAFRWGCLGKNRLKRTERDFSSQFIYLTKSKRCDIIKKLQRRNENFGDVAKRTESGRTSRNVKNIHKKFTWQKFESMI